MLRRLLGTHIVDAGHWYGQGTPLSERRARLHRYTQPAFVISALAVAAGLPAAEEKLLGTGPGGPSSERSVQEWILGTGPAGPSSACGAQEWFGPRAEAACLLPLGFASAFGAALALRGGGGFAWLPHAHERLAWSGAFGCGVVATAHALWPTLARGDAPGMPLLGPSAALMLGAVATERLGGRAGLLITLPLAAVSAASACGGPRPSRLVEAGALGCLPLLLALPPVHTLAPQLVMAFGWVAAAAAYRLLDEREGSQRLRPMSHLFLGLGVASLAWSLHARSPLCQY